MKFFYILNSKQELIVAGRSNSENAELMKKFVCNQQGNDWCKNNLYSISFNFVKLRTVIYDLLQERNSKPLDIPDYKGRFLESDIFEMKNFEGRELKLCNTGFDSKVIFLINIYNSVLRNEDPFYLIFADTHKEFENWKKNNL